MYVILHCIPILKGLSYLSWPHSIMQVMYNRVYLMYSIYQMAGIYVHCTYLIPSYTHRHKLNLMHMHCKTFVNTQKCRCTHTHTRSLANTHVHPHFIISEISSSLATAGRALGDEGDGACSCDSSELVVVGG